MCSDVEAVEHVIDKYKNLELSLVNGSEVLCDLKTLLSKIKVNKQHMAEGLKKLEVACGVRDLDVENALWEKQSLLSGSQQYRYKEE